MHLLGGRQRAEEGSYIYGCSNSSVKLQQRAQDSERTYACACMCVHTCSQIAQLLPHSAKSCSDQQDNSVIISWFHKLRHHAQMRNQLNVCVLRDRCKAVLCVCMCVAGPVVRGADRLGCGCAFFSLPHHVASPAWRLWEKDDINIINKV